MNEYKRDRLNDAASLLDRASAIIDRVKDEEQYSFDNLSEGLQATDRASAMEDGVSDLGEAIDLIGEAAECIERARAR